MGEANEERRREPRIQSVNLVSVAQFDEEGFYADLGVGRTLDISRHGVRVELAHPLPLRSLVSLSISLGGELVEIEGTVCHLEVLGEDMCSMGIRFTGLTPEANDSIHRYLQSVTA
jgi:hypothetical protein